MAAEGTYHDNKQYGGHGRPAQRDRGQGRGRSFQHHPQTTAVSANAAQQQSSIICYKCGEPGHRATSCPTKGTTSGTQRPCMAPPARGHAATGQEGDSHTGGTGNSTRGTSDNAMVCMAQVIHYEQAMSAWRILDYNINPTLCRPPPQPIPVIETGPTGAQLKNIDRFVIMVLPINIGQFNDFLEDHITSGLVPTVYTGSLNPLDDDFWLQLQNYPLAEQDHTFAAIIYLESESKHVISEGVLPILQEFFAFPIDAYAGCIERYCSFVQS